MLSKPQLLQRDPPGPDLTDCTAEPVPTAPFADEAARYAWSGAAIWAGRDCRERLAKLKDWALNPPKP